jgi:hypothetical protein
MKKHVSKFESFQIKKRLGDAIQESVMQVNDIYKVKAVVDIPKSLINQVIKKVKDESGKDLRNFYGDQDIAEEIIKYVNQTFVNSDAIPTAALVGGEVKPGQPGQPVAQVPPAQGQAQAQVQEQPEQPEVSIQSQPEGQAQAQVQAQTEPTVESQGGFESVEESVDENVESTEEKVEETEEVKEEESQEGESNEELPQ